MANLAREILGPVPEASLFTLGGILEFGRIHATRLEESGSPLQIDPGDQATLMLRTVPIGHLEEHLISHFGGSDSESSSAGMVSRTFDAIRALRDPPVTSTADLTADFVARYRIAAAIPEPASGPELYRLTCLRTICRHAIDQGWGDIDPFVGLPEFPTREPRPPTPIDWRKHQIRIKPVVLLATHPMSQDAREPARLPVSSLWDMWDATVCPMRFGAGSEVFLFDRSKTALSRPRDRTALKLFAELIAAYPRGFEWNYLEGKYGDPRGIIRRYRAVDGDFFAALRTPGRKGGGFVGIGRDIITLKHEPPTQSK